MLIDDEYQSIRMAVFCNVMSEGSHNLSPLRRHFGTLVRSIHCFTRIFALKQTFRGELPTCGLRATGHDRLANYLQRMSYAQ